MSFEILALDALINLDAYSKRVAVHLKEDYFEDNSAREVFKLIKSFIGKYSKLPTKESLLIMLSEAKMPEQMYAEASNIVMEFGQTEKPLDPDFMFDETEKWAKERALFNAINASIGIMNGDNKTLDKHSIPELVTNALAVSFDTSIGHDYFADVELQWEYYSDPGERFPFDSDMMNRLTKGGVKKKTLNIVQMGINVGKTTWLIQQSGEWLNRGKNVVYFTMEVAEEVIRERTDVNLMEIDFDKLHALEKQQYLNRVQKLREMTQGTLIIKEFAANTAHVGHFRHVLKELILKKGVKVDMIVVDHLTLVASSRLPSSAANNSNQYYTAVAEELRGLAVEFGVPLWTASQFTRTGQNGNKEIGIDDTGLAIGIPATADFMIAFMQPEEMAPQNKIIGKVLKNRYAGKHKIGKFVMGSDPDLQCFFDVNLNEQKTVMSEEEVVILNAYSQPSQTAHSMQTFDFSTK